MKNDFYDNQFLLEIAESKRTVGQWPQWMLDGTKVLLATVPELAPTSKKDSLTVQPDGKNKSEF